MASTKELAEHIPGIVSFTYGESLASTRPVVDSSYDLAILMRFRDARALAYYESHPWHKKAVSDVLKPLTAKVVIYDIEDDPSSPSLTKP
jgi:hypothetical protein